MKATEDGLLYPHLQELWIDFGRSDIQSNGWFRTFFLRQSFNFGKYIAQDAVNRFGVTLYNMVLPNLLADWTDNHFHKFKMNIP